MSLGTKRKFLAGLFIANDLPLLTYSWLYVINVISQPRIGTEGEQPFLQWTETLHVWEGHFPPGVWTKQQETGPEI